MFPCLCDDNEILESKNSANGIVIQNVTVDVECFDAFVRQNDVIRCYDGIDLLLVLIPISDVNVQTQIFQKIQVTLRKPVGATFCLELKSSIIIIRSSTFVPFCILDP